MGIVTVILFDNIFRVMNNKKRDSSVLIVKHLRSCLDVNIRTRLRGTLPTYFPSCLILPSPPGAFSSILDSDCRTKRSTHL